MFVSGNCRKSGQRRPEKVTVQLIPEVFKFKEKSFPGVVCMCKRPEAAGNTGHLRTQQVTVT